MFIFPIVPYSLVVLHLTIPFVALTVTSPLSWLPTTSDARSLLGYLLTAQAAIAALTLAVTLFVMQGARAQRDSDDRMYSEYVHRSWIIPCFWSGLGAVGVTGTVLVALSFVSTGEQGNATSPELRNLILLVPPAFVVNLLTAGVLFLRSINLSQPGIWGSIRRHVNERDVREAVQVFLRKYQQSIAAQEAGELNLATAFPDAGEGSANDSIQILLDDGRRAMDERRLKELELSLNSIKQLVVYAMNEMEKAGLGWGAPGSQPQWPPLRELGRNLYTFRQNLISHGDRDFRAELLKFDYWAIKTGLLRNCGELFTEGLAGYRWNYQIAGNVGNREFREVFRDRLWDNVFGIMVGRNPIDTWPFIRQIVKHQEYMLSDALHADRVTDFERLHRGFKGFLRIVSWHWRHDRWSEQETEELVRGLERDYRIVLMGLGGRSVLLANSGRIENPNNYLDVVRTTYGRIELLGGDAAQALAHENVTGFGPWSEWEMEGAEPNTTQMVQPEQYPLTFFGLRLMELSTNAIGNLDLHGHAQRVLDWFNANSGRFEGHVLGSAEPDAEERRKSAVAALQVAIRKDVVEEDYQIIRRELSAERTTAFVSDVYASAFATNFIERIFDQSKSFLYILHGAEGSPSTRFIRNLVPKGFLAVVPEDASIYYSPLEGDQYGQSHSDAVVRLLCEALEESPSTRVSLNNTLDLLRAIDQAIEDLNPSNGVMIVLEGDWAKVVVELAVEDPQGYESGWQASETDVLGQVDRYRGHPVVTRFTSEARRLFVVDPATWGCLVRAQVEGNQDLFVEVKPITRERARVLLDENPRHFSEEPDEASKLRRLQTYVEIVINYRVGFRVIDPCRARQIVDAHQGVER